MKDSEYCPQCGVSTAVESCAGGYRHNRYVVKWAFLCGCVVYRGNHFEPLSCWPVLREIDERKNRTLD